MEMRAYPDDYLSSAQRILGGLLSFRECHFVRYSCLSSGREISTRQRQ